MSRDSLKNNGDWWTDFKVIKARYKCLAYSHIPRIERCIQKEKKNRSGE